MTGFGAAEGQRFDPSINYLQTSRFLMGARRAPRGQ
jgi:hypothetical protein